MQLDRYIFMPKISLKPNRVTLFNEVLIPDHITGELRHISAMRGGSLSADGLKKPMVQKLFHNFTISPSAQKKIQEKINKVETNKQKDKKRKNNLSPALASNISSL